MTISCTTSSGLEAVALASLENQLSLYVGPPSVGAIALASVEEELAEMLPAETKFEETRAWRLAPACSTAAVAASCPAPPSIGTVMVAFAENEVTEPSLTSLFPTMEFATGCKEGASYKPEFGVAARSAAVTALVENEAAGLLMTSAEELATGCEDGPTWKLALGAAACSAAVVVGDAVSCIAPPSAGAAVTAFVEEEGAGLLRTSLSPAAEFATGCEEGPARLELGAAVCWASALVASRSVPPRVETDAPIFAEDEFARPPPRLPFPAEEFEEDPACKPEVGAACSAAVMAA
jgi:hypothetical protein